MKKIELSLLFIILVAYSFAQKPDANFFDKIAFQKQANFINKSTFVESQSYNLTDFVYQRMEWKINPEILFIEGVVTTWFKSEIQDLNEIEFDLHDSLSVDSVTHKNGKLTFNRTQNKLIVNLPDVLNKGQLDSISVYYKGRPPETGSDAFSKTMHEDVPNIWTLSEPYGAMEWWPCKQSLVDKIDSIDVIVTSPELYRTASNGILVSETVTNGKRKMHWKHRFPIATYLIAISVTNYSSYSDFLELDNGQKIEILNFVYPENLQNAKLKTPFTAEAIALYNELIGEYPFANEKYGHAQFGWGGGMEHQTMSFMGSFHPSLIAHELAHQWFGDYITLGSWHDIWLNEGFATFLTGLSYEHIIDDGFWWPAWRETSIEKIVSEPDGSVFVKDTTDVAAIFSGRLSYSKGAYILHMLRWILGDENFFSGIRNYFNDPAIANGFASTSQLVKHMETAGDTILTEFFNDWFYGEGFPIYSARFSPGELNSTKIILSQTTSHQSVDFFEMPVQVRVYNSAKTDSADFRLVNTKNNQEFIIKPAFKVADLKIDPNLWLISKTNEIVGSPVILTTNKMSVFPNPFSNNISIKINTSMNINSIKVISIEGLLIKEIDSHIRNLNLSELPKGVYILQVETETGHFEKQIVKQ